MTTDARHRGRTDRKGATFLHGPAGHPIHPPLTGIVVGTMTIGTLSAIVGAFGIAEEALADAAFVGVVAGLVAAVPTAISGFLDYRTIARGTPLRRAAAIHWVVNLTALATYIAAGALLEPGPGDGDVSPEGAVVAAVGWLLLSTGGYLGGTMVFRYGMRVDRKPDEPLREAIRWGHQAEASVRRPPPGAR